MKSKAWIAVLLLYVILGNWKGYLALFEGEAAEPRQIYPKLVEELSEEDQNALNEGVLIRNDRLLKQLLEGYLS